jgi:riboflavin kinase, archaea type
VVVELNHFHELVGLSAIDNEWHRFAGDASFENMPRVRGKVVSGCANFGFWIERLNRFYEKKTGMRLYPGTLNIELFVPYTLPSNVIRLEANEYGGSVSVNIVPCQIFDHWAFLLRADQNEQGTGHHSRNIIEIATDIRLRDAYQLEDGDWVEIEVP